MRRRWFVPALLLLLAMIGLRNQLLRPLWYDEALTFMEFVARDSFTFIYRYYPIPNNHIAYNWLLLGWIRIMGFLPLPGDLLFRLLGLALTAISLLVMARCWRRRIGATTVLLAGACLIMAPAFPVYAPAVRGYQLGFLAVLLALESGRRWRDGGPRWLGLAYFAAGLLAVGAMPTNLLALAAIPLLPDRPPTPANVLRPRRLWLALAPLLAFAVFYLPIGGQLLRVMALREGWPGFAAAAGHYYAAAALMALPLLAGALPGLAARRFSAWTLAATAGVFLLPAMAMLARRPVPFPRAFYPFWPIWLFLIAIACRHGQAVLRRRRGRRFAHAWPWLCFALALAAGMAANHSAAKLSVKLTPSGGQDDFFQPYFMRDDFRPWNAVAEALALSDGIPGTVFLHPGADPYSLIYCGRMRRAGLLREDHWLCDRPGRPHAFAEPPRQLWLVARTDAQANDRATAYGLTHCHLVADCGYHRIYHAAAHDGN